jgi:hypothetical protein
MFRRDVPWKAIVDGIDEANEWINPTEGWFAKHIPTLEVMLTNLSECRHGTKWLANW